MTIHEKYMERCLKLAKNGLGRAAPNPLVGCVVTWNDKIIGDGFHKRFGGAHAEVNAINSVKNKNLLRHACLYVNLEPCSHFGKTPPCADLIIRSGIKQVVIGDIDPNPVVRGKGINKLALSGCHVKVGVLQEECKELNKRFYAFHEKKRPYIILKWAETKDNCFGISNLKPDGYRVQISNFKSQKLVHQWRSEEQAIMVGTHTALTDNPKLTVRKVKGKNPMRIVIDRNLSIPSSFHLLDGSVPTLVFTAKKESAKTDIPLAPFKKGKKENLEFVKIDFSKNVLKQILNELMQRQIQSLLVEGGAKLLQSFLTANLWDEARVFTSAKLLLEIVGRKEKGIEAPQLKKQSAKKEKIGSDILKIYRN